MNTMNPIGDVVRRYRHEKNLSQDELSKLSGIAYNTIVKLENSHRPVNPTIMTLFKIASVLDIEIEKLLISPIQENLNKM